MNPTSGEFGATGQSRGEGRSILALVQTHRVASALGKGPRTREFDTRRPAR